jgi:hypothetical protein
VRIRHAAALPAERRVAVAPSPDTADPDALGRYDQALDDGVAEALTARAQDLRVPMFSVALAAFALACGAWCGDDGPTVLSTFAARETPDEEAAVGWLANEVLIPLEAPPGTVEARIRQYARHVYARLSTQRVPWVPAGEAAAAGGLSVSMVYLAEALTGGAGTGLRIGGATVHPFGVSICPSGADLELYVAERPLVLDRDDRPRLLVGGISQRSRAGQAQLEETVARWADAIGCLAGADWRQTEWAALLRNMEGAMR